MPNATNIQRPIVLVGAGRSGTSLVSRLFDLRSDCSTVGETANLVFGPWHAVAQSSASIAPLSEQGAWISEDERAGRVVRATFLTCFPDDKPHWMQKPIGVPKALGERFEDVTSPEAGAFYWHVLRTSFPNATFIGILRHPCDAVLSGRSKWGFSDRGLWRTLGAISSYLTHADSPVRYVIRYEQLVATPEATVREICDAAGVAYDAAMLAGFDEVHVPAPGREKPSESGYTRREDWAALDPAALTPANRRAIAAAFDRFGGGLDWPTHFDAPPMAASSTASSAMTSVPASEIERLRTQMGQLSSRLERAMVDHAAELRRRDEAWQQREHSFASREKELTALWAEQKEWIEDLERVKAWLQEQVANWRAMAEGRD